MLILLEDTKLRKNQELRLGEWLANVNKRYILIMQEDGNLVLSHINLNRVLWQSNTAGKGDRLRMESDGNLVIYDKNNQTVWQTNTSGKGEYLQLLKDANLVVFDSNRLEVWSTGTSLSKFYLLFIQSKV